MELARGDKFPAGQRRVPAAPGEDTVLHPEWKYFHISPTPTNRERERRSSGSTPPRTVWKPVRHWLIAGWLGLMVLARGESCPFRQRRDPAAVGEDTVLYPDLKSFQIFTNPTNPERKQRFPGWIVPGTVWKPSRHWLTADWLVLMEPAHGENFPVGQRRSPAAPGEDKILHPDQKYFNISITRTTQERKRRSSGSIPRRTLWKNVRQWLIADWLGLMEPARGEISPLGQRRRPAVVGEDRFFTRIRNPPKSTNPTTLRRKQRSPGSIPPRIVWKFQPHKLIADRSQPTFGVALFGSNVSERLSFLREELRRLIRDAQGFGYIHLTTPPSPLRGRKIYIFSVFVFYYYLCNNRTEKT